MSFWFSIPNVRDKLTVYFVSIVMFLKPVCSCSSTFFHPRLDMGLVVPEAYKIFGALFKKKNIKL
jgi:hypothetical protein